MSALLNFFNGFDLFGEGPMTRMMRTEYRRDYEHAVENKFMSEAHAKAFINRVNM